MSSVLQKDALNDVFERITDAFVALDKEWRYTYMNKKAGEIFNRDPKQMIGKHIWTEFPEGIDQPFHKAYVKAMNEQRYVYLEEYYSPYGRWFENHIYPSPEGLSIFFRDITEKKKVELALRYNEATTRLIMNSALDAIICMNRSGAITVWTRQAEKIFGWKEEDVLGKQLTDTIIPAQYRESHKNGLKKYLETGEGSMLNKLVEITALNRNGREFPVELTIVPVKHGEEIFFCSFIRDITKRKKAEEELQESELRYRSLIEQASDSIMITDTKGNFSDVNSSLCKLFGYTREELLKSNISALIDPEQLANDPIRFDLLLTGQPMLRERRMKHKDGTIIEVEANVKMLPDGRVLAIARDITDRKKAEAKIEASEKKLRQVLSSTPDNFYAIDRNYNVILINETAERNLHRAWGKPVSIGTNLLDVIPKSGEPIIESFEKVFAGERIEYELALSDVDLPAWVLVNFMPVTDESGIITGAYVIGKDITERKKAEEAIKESEERYRTLVENAPEALVVLDVEKRRFVSVSESAVKLFKKSKEELLQVGPIDLSPEFQPDGRLSSDAGLEKINEAVAGGKPSFEWIHCDADGNLIPCEVWLVRLPSEKQILVRGSIIDITDRKKAQEELRESEQKYKLLFESNPLPMFMFSRDDFCIIDVNESAIRHYGFSRNEFLEMKMTELRPVEDVSKFLEKVITAADKTTNLGTWRHKKKNGMIISVEIIGYDIIYHDKPVRLVLANDVTEKLTGEEKLKQSYNEVRRLTNHLQNIREEERTHIAREIHDELGQQLTVLKMDASWLNKKLALSDELTREKLKGLLEVLDGTVKTVRRISSELRPSLLDDLGLKAAIAWHLKDFGKRSDIQTKFIAADDDILLPDEMKTGLFRILQESLTNVARHAGAKKVKVSLAKKNDELVLRIEDDGRGFDKVETAGKKTLGVLGMEERSQMMGGNYQISSQPGEGTVVTVSVPYKLQTNK